MTEQLVRQMPMIEGFVPTRLFTLVRFGMWDDVLQTPARPQTFHTPPPCGIMRAAWPWWKRVGSTMPETNYSSCAKCMPRFRPIDWPVGTRWSTLVAIAADILAGKLAAGQGKPDDAVAHLERPSTCRTPLQYDEPPPGIYPVRQSLGAVAPRKPAGTKRPKPSIARISKSTRKTAGHCLAWRPACRRKTPPQAR